MHSGLGHAMTRTDLACVRFRLYFILVVLMTLARPPNFNCTVNDFKFGYFWASRLASSDRSRCAWRCSARGFFARRPLIAPGWPGTREAVWPYVASVTSSVGGCASVAPVAF